MSNIYASEPATRGKVVLTTTAGDIDIELWTLEAKKTCRNFIQLCLEGYYDNTSFHRIVKDFIVQGGDPTGTGTGGESIYGEEFADEFHSRLRFTHRGIVAMANTGRHTNRSQFFITLGPTEGLNGKNTIFGKVTGDTIFNVLRMGDFPVGEEERPLYPPKILSTEVLLNPFDDIIPREKPKPKEPHKEEVKPRKEPAAKRDMKVLSFGEEEEQEVPATKKPRMKSSHFFEDGGANDTAAPVAAPTENQPETKEDKKEAKKEDTNESMDTNESQTEDADTSEVKRRKHKSMKPVKRKRKWAEATDDNEAPTPVLPTYLTEEEKARKQKEDLKREQKLLKKSILSLKKPTNADEGKSDMEEVLSPLQMQNAKYQKRGKKVPTQRERETMDKLLRFKDSLKTTTAEWKGHTLKFAREPGTKVEEEELYSVFDPRLQKGKSKVPAPSRHKQRLTQTGEAERW